MRITKERFKYIIEKHILPLIPIAHEGKIIFPNDLDKYSSKYPREMIHVGNIDDNEYLVFSPRRDSAEFFYVSKLSCRPAHSKKLQSVLATVLASINKFGNPDDERSILYIDALCQTSITIGICSLLSASVHDSSLLVKIIYALEKWSHKTYEGRKVPFGIILDWGDTNNGDTSPDYVSFLESKHSATLTDGVFSAIVLNAYGQIAEYLTLSPSKSISRAKNHIDFVPARFENFSKHCTDQRIGLVALSNGDILIIKGGELVYAKREGIWLAYGYSAFFRPCMDKLLHFQSLRNNKRKLSDAEKLSKYIYLSILDASFAHSGACISIANFKEHNSKLVHVLRNCLISEEIDSSTEFITKMGTAKYNEMKTKQAILRQLTHCGNPKDAHSFSRLSQKLRAELLSMDGAMVIDELGTIHAVGAILSIQSGSEEGGRMAATRQLSKFGVAFKVSEDGGITGIFDEKVILKIG